MGEHRAQFSSRIRGLENRHRRYARDGYTTRVRSDGLVEVVPRKRVSSKISTRSIFFFVGALLLFKAFLMASIGFDSYDERVARLAEGTGLERLGAKVMQSDPVTKAIAEVLQPYLP